MLELETLGSNSKGNCYIIRTLEEVLLLECGVPKTKIKKALDYDYSKVVGCLISHEHKDHCKAVKDVAEMGIDIYATAGTITGMKFKDHRVATIYPLEKFKVGNFTVLPFPAAHDAAQPVGFLIYHKQFGKLMFLTDSYYCKYKFKELNYIMIECNYSKEILEKNIAAGYIPKALKQRIVTSHLSLENVKKYLEKIDLSAVKGIMLIHLSDGNSDAKLFKEEIQKLTGKSVWILS